MQRTISPQDFIEQQRNAVIYDVRRSDDYNVSNDFVDNAVWKNPVQIDDWIDDIPRDRDVIIYCVRGGSVSNSVLDRLREAGVRARYIEGGIEALKSSGAKVVRK